MTNDLQNLTEDISRLYADITRLYDELQTQLQGISTEELEVLQGHIKSTLEQMVGISKSLAVIKTLKVTLNDHDDIADSGKKNLKGKDAGHSTEDR